MRSTAVGLHPLPVELWEEIFAIASDADAYWAEKQGSWCTISNPFFTAKEGLLRDPMACDNLGLLRTRHSIILVCKSWYFMGIPILWSHLQFHEKDPRNVAMTIYSAIKRNPTLASHVLRLTIKPVIFRPNLKPEKIHAVAKFLPLLTNIEAISCSLPYATNLYPSIQPGIVMLSSYGTDSAILDSARAERRIFRDSFWIHCRTLSLTLRKDCGDIWSILNRIYIRREITFDNLIEFRLDIEHKEVLEWITRCWNFPLLKTLSISKASWPRHVQLLYRVCGTLERLQICDGDDYFNIAQEVVMPNLKEIHLVNAKSVVRLPAYILRASPRAPNLRRFVMSWHPNSERRQSTRTVIFSIISLILSRYPSLKELVIIFPAGEWVRSSEEDSRVVLLLKDIALWCEKGVVVEIVTGKNAERRRCGKGSLPVDEFGGMAISDDVASQIDIEGHGHSANKRRM